MGLEEEDLPPDFLDLLKAIAKSRDPKVLLYWYAAREFYKLDDENTDKRYSAREVLDGEFLSNDSSQSSRPAKEKDAMAHLDAFRHTYMSGISYAIMRLLPNGEEIFDRVGDRNELRENDFIFDAKGFVNVDEDNESAVKETIKDLHNNRVGAALMVEYLIDLAVGKDDTPFGKRVYDKVKGINSEEPSPIVDAESLNLDDYRLKIETLDDRLRCFEELLGIDSIPIIGGLIIDKNNLVLYDCSEFPDSAICSVPVDKNQQTKPNQIK